MNRVLKYSLMLFGGISLVTLGANVFSTAIIEGFQLNLFWKVVVVIFESLAIAGVLTVIGINTFPVIKEMIVTMRRLIRYDNLSHPLLIRLSQEAPSTYHHSIMVANLAYRAAKTILADPILTRVGAYYHDVGKLINPDHFAENLASKPNDQNTNVHDYLDPKTSVKMITNHVKEGIRLANEYHLPPDVINFITQHHGTSVAKFFYEKAKQAGLKNRKAEFRYPGPKPLSKETALVMLADAIESKIRATPVVNDQTISQVVDEIIDEKLNDGQLELSGLVDRDFAKLRRAFSEAVSIMVHRRIRYPNQ
jgi:putative nucleotidyltransferase with HDIG domain